MCWRAKSTAAAITIACIGVIASFANAFADTLESALAYTYVNNPQLNAQRALVRATDESVPQALAGYRPKASVTGNLGVQSLSTKIREIGSTTALNAPPSFFRQSGYNFPRGYGATISQTLMNGFQTANRTRLAESQVLSARETLRALEQTVMLNAVTVYMNLLRDKAILELQRSNVDVLQEQLRQTKQRLESGNVTATDVAQAESRVSVGRTQLFAAEANYQSSRAVFHQIVGYEAGQLSPASPVDRFLPVGNAAASAAAVTEHPNVVAAQYNADAAAFQVKIAEGALYPTISVQGTLQHQWDSTLNGLESFSAGVSGQVSVPIYQGGAEYAAVRQAKETEGQKRLDLNVTREQQRATLMQALAQLESAKRSIQSSRVQVKSAESALNGVREEARLGQRTTLDVLNAQQELVNARIALVSAQRDRVVNSYAVLAAVGRLSPQVLKLPVPVYDSTVHYHQVRDAWAGIRTPDGR